MKESLVLSSTVAQKFHDKYVWDEVTDCMIWIAYRNKDGYGICGTGGTRNTTAHRVSYILHFGSIPDGLHIDHLCRRRSCVNPEHLEAVTPGENARRANFTRPPITHCGRSGHEYTSENTRMTSAGARLCLACRREYDVEYKRKLRAARKAQQ